ncbi:MAG: M48 family metalloprotease [Blastocatellia bacterium]
MFNKKSGYLACALLLLLAAVAPAQAPQRDMEKEQRIWQALQAIAPDMVETFKAATAALDKNDFAEAVRLYELVYKKAPNYDVVMRRLGGSLVLSGREQEGFATLEAAVKKKESAENFFSVAQFLALPTDGSQPRRENLERALPYVRQAADLSHDNDPRYLILWAMISVKTGRLEYVRQATARLKETHPDIMETHYFNAWVGVEDKDWRKVESELQQAQAMGLSVTAAEEVRDAAGLRSRGSVWRYAHYTLYAVGLWLVGLELLFVLGRIFSKKTLWSLETGDPGEVGGQRRLRRYYRWLINAASAYYYLSLPVILFLMLAVTASVLYALLLLNRISVYIILLFALVALLAIYTLVRSLFVKVNSSDPGRALHESEAPELFALAREVAQVVGTRPIDAIRVTPDTELVVYERGSLRECARDRGHRVLLLGVANLNDFELNAFCAVLAHEYGHVRHRDTAGGDVARRVTSDIMKFALALTEHRQAVWYNLAFQFLRAYQFIFHRISYGATRLQEAMADRVAAINYGPQAFEAGLRHVNSRQISEDDTRPAPAERFRFAHCVAFAGELPPSRMVWELFADRVALTEEMSALASHMVPAAGV